MLRSIRERLERAISYLAWVFGARSSSRCASSTSIRASAFSKSWTRGAESVSAVGVQARHRNNNKYADLEIASNPQVDTI